MENDNTRAEAAFNALRSRLEAIPADRLDAVRTSPQRTAHVALSVAEHASRPEVRSRFERLAKAGEFDLGHLEVLAEAARAVWYVRQRLETLVAAQGDGQVEAKLYTQATTTRTRMLRVLEYHLGDDPALAARLAAIRGGKGYHDLANDLVSLAELYRLHRGALVEDRRHYRADDEAEAALMAAEINRQAGGGAAAEVERWTDLQLRAGSLLRQAYEEVRRAGQFLFYSEDAETRFPSLFGAARSTRGRPAVEE